MIDFETLGVSENKVIIQVGAVFFDHSTGELGAEFKANIDAISHVALGGKMDAQTVYWWLAQSDAARQSILAEPREDIVQAMAKLNDFLEPAKRIWSHATFDFVTLIETFRLLKIKPKFNHKAGLDLRTLNYLSGISTKDFTREGLHHDGLEDAKHQVKYCVAALNAVKTNKQAINLLNKLIKD